MMDSDEREIYFYLKGQPDRFIPISSIGRHAGGKHKYRGSPDWAKPALLRMEERAIGVADATGAYQLKPRPKTQSAAKRWVSPQIAAILKKSGQDFDHVIKNGDDADAYYESL